MKRLDINSIDEEYSTCLQRNNIRALVDLSDADDITSFTRYKVISAHTALKILNLGWNNYLFTDDTLRKYLDDKRTKNKAS